VSDEEPLVPGIDVTRPSVARIYDYWLGGKDNFAVDRERAATHARFFNHDVAAVASWLTGLEVVPPGVCGANQWVAGTGGVPSGRPAYPLVAAAVKTSD
jgi:hypothetical protein